MTAAPITSWHDLHFRLCVTNSVQVDDRPKNIESTNYKIRSYMRLAVRLRSCVGVLDLKKLRSPLSTGHSHWGTELCLPSLRYNLVSGFVAFGKCLVGSANVFMVDHLRLNASWPSWTGVP